jgi:hypothetical protein
MSFFTGTPGSYQQHSTLTPEQQNLFSQFLAAVGGQGGQGAFGDIARYYQDLLNPEGQAFNAFAAPEQRRFQEETIPGLAEQFAGMGAGGLSSSGFRNAGIQAGTDLNERLAGIRQQLRQQGISGLQNFASGAFNPVSENIYKKGQPGLVDFAGPALGAAGAAFAGPLGGAAGQFLGGQLSKFGKSNPYGGGDPRAARTVPPSY